MSEEEYPGGVPPTWRMTVRSVVAQDGRCLVYYAFVPAPDVREVVLVKSPEEWGL